MKVVVFATSPQGFSCHLELEGEKVYSDALKLLAQLEKDGFTPAPEGHQQGHQIDVQPSSNSPDGSSQHSPEHFCQDHGVAFVERKGKNGATFYSHKQGDGWCNEAKR
jgi:hypothetical protein